MAKATVKIPKMDAAIICRNEREKKAAWIFVNNMRDTAKWAAESDDPTYWARRVVDPYGGCTEYTVTELHGIASTFYYMGMLDEPIGSVEIADAIRAMYLEEIGAAGDTADTPADDADMDAIKADAAWVLGIDEGSDEWCELMSI